MARLTLKQKRVEIAKIAKQLAKTKPASAKGANRQTWVVSVKLAGSHAIETILHFDLDRFYKACGYRQK